MVLNFKDIIRNDIYNTVRVMAVVGPHVTFNNIVVDRIRNMCTDNTAVNSSAIAVTDEFGLADANGEITQSVDFNTFIDVANVASIVGKWYCNIDYTMLTKKQKTQFFEYIKAPTENGILVVTSTDWFQYKDLLKNRAFRSGKNTHIIQLSFPDKPTLRTIIRNKFNEKQIDISSQAIDMFIIKMNKNYDDYDEEIDRIIEMHEKQQDTEITQSYMKEYLHGIENYTVDDFVTELLKPMSSDKTNSKKVLRILVMLEDEIGAKNLCYQLLRIVQDEIEFRLLINKGYIPIGIKYFFKETINDIGIDKYTNMSEFVFRRKAFIASQTSLEDWVFMKLALENTLSNNKISDDAMNAKCQKVLYEIATRYVLKESRIKNCIKLDNIFHDRFNYFDSTPYIDMSSTGG